MSYATVRVRVRVILGFGLRRVRVRVRVIAGVPVQVWARVMLDDCTTKVLRFMLDDEN